MQTYELIKNKNTIVGEHGQASIIIHDKQTNSWWSGHDGIHLT